MKKRNYRVRVVIDDLKHTEVILDDLSYTSALEWFTFYVRSALELSLSTPIWCVNLFSGSKCIKFFQNYGLSRKG